MKKTLFLLASASVFAVSCGNGGVKKVDQTVEGVEVAEPVEVRGYEGTLPGADVPGIVYHLTLTSVAEDNAEGNYNLDMTYLEAENGEDQTFTTKGTWKYLEVDDAKGPRVIYRLISNEPRPDTMNFQYLGDSMVMLTDDLQRIPSPHNYTLKVK